MKKATGIKLGIATLALAGAGVGTLLTRAAVAQVATSLTVTVDKDLGPGAATQFETWVMNNLGTDADDALGRAPGTTTIEEFRAKGLRFVWRTNDSGVGAWKALGRITAEGTFTPLP